MFHFSSPFHFIAKLYSIVWMYLNLFIHLPAGGNLGCFQFLAIVNKTAVNIQVQPLVDTCFHFFGVSNIGVELLWHKVCLTVQETAKLS